MSKEKDCKWYFGPEGGADNGPTNPSKGTFRSLPDINVVREAIQNSLDVPVDPDLPVEVKFSFSKLSSSDFPAFFGIREHIRESLRFYQHTDRAKEKFPGMIKYLSSGGDGTDIDNPGKYVDSIGVLTVSDYNTKGMTYAKDDRTCSFYAFFHSIGVSVDKGEGSGGSNGLGKETLYNRSEIKTLLLSTKNQKGEVVFQGASKLTTHKDPETGSKVTAFGYYGRDKDEPVTQEDQIPEGFLRNEVGTDIHIVGVRLDNPDEIRNSIILAVLNHFWLAVHREKLVVDVDGVMIKKKTLEGLINKYFADNRETQTDRYEKWNPRPYYNAILNVDGKKEKTKCEEAELDVLGHVRFFIDWSADDLPKRIAYMRQPRMVIYKKPRKAYPSFVAIFVCDNDVGNRILRCVEPPAHDAWGIENYEGQDKAKHKAAIIEVDKFVNMALDKYLKPKSTHNEIIIPGLAELLPDADERTPGCETGTVGSGASDGLQPSGELANKETAAPVSFVEEDSSMYSAPEDMSGARGSANSLVEDVTPKNRDDDQVEPEEIIGVPTNETTGGDGGGGGESDNGTTTKQDLAPKTGAKAHVKVRVLVTPMFLRKDGVLWHRLIVRPDPKGKASQYKNIKLFLTTGSDNNAQDTTKIKSVVGLPPTVVVGVNSVAGLDICQGVKFDVLFEDQIVHSVKVVAYASN